MKKDYGVFLTTDLMNWEWFSEPNTLSVFLFILIKAAPQNKSWRGVKLKRGELMISVLSISEATGLSVSNVRTALKHLTISGDIEIKTFNKGSLIKVLNYDLYSGGDADV